MDIYSYHEGEDKVRGAVAPLKHPRQGFGKNNGKGFAPPNFPAKLSHSV